MNEMSDKVKSFIKEWAMSGYGGLPVVMRKLRTNRLEKGIRYTDEEIQQIYDIVTGSNVMIDTESIHQVPPSEMWRLHKEYSRHPTAFCGNRDVGLPVCPKGEGKFCYYRKPCGSQVQLNGEQVSEEAKREADRMVQECRERNKEALENYEREMDAIDYHDMIRRIIGG